MSKIFFYASYSMSFCQGVIYINAPKILMANEAPTQKSTDIFLPHVVKTQTDTLGSASRFIKTYALQKHPTLASALSHQTVTSCSWLIHLPLFAHPSALKTTTQIQPIPSHQHPLTCCGRQEMIWTESLCWLFWTRAHRSLGRRRGAKIPHGAARSCWGSAGHPPAQPGMQHWSQPVPPSEKEVAPQNRQKVHRRNEMQMSIRISNQISFLFGRLAAGLKHG